MSADDEYERPVDETAPEGDRADDPDEGEIAADYLEEFLDILDLDGDIDIEEQDDRVVLRIESDESDSRLGTIGDHRTVQALQDLTRLAVQQRLGERSRLVLDVQGSRERRREELRGRVRDASERLSEGDADVVELEPMSSYERKLVHDFARELDLDSTSEGEGRNRHVVLSLVEDNSERDEEGSDEDA